MPSWQVKQLGWRAEQEQQEWSAVLNYSLPFVRSIKNPVLHTVQTMGVAAVAQVQVWQFGTRAHASIHVPAKNSKIAYRYQDRCHNLDHRFCIWGHLRRPDSQQVSRVNIYVDLCDKGILLKLKFRTYPLSHLVHCPRTHQAQFGGQDMLHCKH